MSNTHEEEQSIEEPDDQYVIDAVVWCAAVTRRFSSGVYVCL